MDSRIDTYTHIQTVQEEMNLVSILEMLCDWKAATLRYADGDIHKSIELNQKRFGYSDEFKQVFLNTLPLLEGYGA